MKKGRVFHLEDRADWIRRVRSLLGDEYEYHSAKSLGEAAKLFYELAADDLKFDLAIIDISLIKDDPFDKQGLKFIEALETSGVMLGHSIIVLSGYSEIDENLRIAFRDYDVVDVFDKARYKEEKAQLKQTVEQIIERLKS